MIGNDFIYCRAENESEAVELYQRFCGEGIVPLYFGGGTEIITMCRAGSIKPPAVIDLKRIPSLSILTENEGFISIGAACTLETIRVSGIFPLLGETGGRISDHTNQCGITLGGNICGTIIYRETILPLLVADAEFTLFGTGGERNVSVHDIFNQQIKLFPGEFIVSVQIDSNYKRLPYAHIKKTFSEKIGYPAVTAVALLSDGKIRAAFSGICSYPFRNERIEQVLNDCSLTVKARIETAAALLPEPPRTDCEGTGEYRLQLFKLALEEIMEIQNK